MTWMSSNDRQKLQDQLADMSLDEVVALRDNAVSAKRREQERRDRLRLTDPLGTLRIYNDFDHRTILVRIGPSSWQPFTTYRTEAVEDHQLHHNSLSEPLMVLTPEQMEALSL